MRAPMNDPITTLGLAFGTAWTAGINLYATIAALGLAAAAGAIQLPPELQVLAHPAVIAVALVLYLIEFFADKVPILDSAWDALHTFIRVPAGALLAARAMGPVSPPLELVALLLGGSVALASHAAKASTRIAINASPEPVSNWIASVAEDVLALVGVWLALRHPLLMLTFVVLFVAIVIWAAPRVWRGLRTVFRRVGSWLSGAPTSPATPSSGGPTTPAAPPA